MFEYLRKIFIETHNIKGSSSADSASNNKKVEVAACALFIEMAKADGEYSDEERNFIVSEMKNTFSLDDEYVNELIQLAEQRIKESVSLYEFTGVINTTFSHDEKIQLIEILWKLIYKDEKLSEYEDHLMKRIAGTINVEHKDIINAKLWVKQQLGLK
jgi:uncharacterized tellurite resistance protein B-like protein